MLLATEAGLWEETDEGELDEQVSTGGTEALVVEVSLTALIPIEKVSAAVCSVRDSAVPNTLKIDVKTPENS